MIKYINNGEIENLKNGFFNTILLKKLELLPFNDYKEKKVQFNIADSIFRILVALNNSDYYKDANLMFDYLCDPYINKYECISDRIEFMDKYIENLCKRYNMLLPEKLNINFQLKKLTLLPVNDFMEKKVSFNVAKSIFNSLIFIDKHKYKGYASVMLDYLYHNHQIDNEDYEGIKNKIIDTTYDNTNEEIESAYDDIDERITFFERYLKKLCKKNNIELKNASFFCIFDNMYDDEIFDEIRNDLYAYAGIDDVSDEVNDYGSTFVEDAQLYILKDFELNYQQVSALNAILGSYYENIQSEVYVRNGNTYLTLTAVYFLDCISYLIFIALNIFVNQNITKN